MCCLGFSMVVLLMEDVKHEVDAAHAELAVAHDNLRRASFYDLFMGWLNTQASAEGLGLEAARAGFGAVMVLDMDNLKDINDKRMWLATACCVISSKCCARSCVLPISCTAGAATNSCSFSPVPMRRTSRVVCVAS